MQKRTHAGPITATSHYWRDRMDPAIRAEATADIGPYPGRVPGGSPIVQQALTHALHELLRPVFIRDVAITILGGVADEALDDAVQAAEPSPYAGYGVSQEAMDAQLAEDTKEGGVR